MTFTRTITVASLFAMTGALAAPTPVVVEKKSLTLEGARVAIAAVVEEAKRLQAPGAAIALVDDGGNVVCVERLDGTFAAGARISAGKARTAALFKKPTSFFEKIIREGRTPMVALEDFTPLQGGVPIVVAGEVVGAIGVSGAASAQQDEDLAIVGAAAAASASAARPQPQAEAVYFDSKRVNQAFAKGEVLLDGEGRNYMVHASRRDRSGVAEVHAKDTDIIHVLGGSATFVTGGTLVEPAAASGDDEARASGIEGGETRRLAPGDVIVVPKGTPHWFREVQSPLTYYVVKVR